LVFDATFIANESPADLIEQAGGQQASLEDKAHAACQHFIKTGRIHKQKIHS
jgi:hypothetical protein